MGWPGDGDGCAVPRQRTVRASCGGWVGGPQGVSVHSQAWRPVRAAVVRDEPGAGVHGVGPGRPLWAPSADFTVPLVWDRSLGFPQGPALGRLAAPLPWAWALGPQLCSPDSGSREWLAGWGKVFHLGPQQARVPRAGRPHCGAGGATCRGSFTASMPGLRIEELFSIIRGQPARWGPLPSPCLQPRTPASGAQPGPAASALGRREC